MKNFAFVTFFAFLTVSCQFEKEIIPEADNGILDLSAWDFTAKGAIDLNGEWLFLSA